MNQKYDLNIAKLHEEREKVIDAEYIKLKKKIKECIFSTVKYMNYDCDRYYIAKSISEMLFKNEDDMLTASVIGVGFKRSLSESHRVLMDSLIFNEYSHILTLQSTIEDLQRQLSYYKSLSEYNAKQRN